MSKVKFDFTGERYVVTGASSGMGKDVALELAEAGAVVLGIGRSENRLAELQSNFPKNIVTASLDVCDYEALERTIGEFTLKYGKLNGGVHAAGILDLTPLRSTDRISAKKVMDVSFWAGMELLRLVTKNKYSKNGTSTVMFSSVASRYPERGMFAYSATKSALDSAIRSAAKEISVKKHRVNTILPGWIKSPMTENANEATNTEMIFNRHLLGIGEPEYVTKMVLFLLSDDARWITGSNVVVDGGYLA